MKKIHFLKKNRPGVDSDLNKVKKGEISGRQGLELRALCLLGYLQTTSKNKRNMYTKSFIGNLKLKLTITISFSGFALFPNEYECVLIYRLYWKTQSNKQG